MIKVQQIFNSVSILQKVLEINMPIQKAYKISKLIKQIEEQQYFFAKEEQKLVAKFNGQIGEQGQITFDNVENQLKFLQAHNEFLNYEIPDMKPIELTFTDVEGAQFTAKELLMLDGVIDFVDGGNQV
jgi:hypothetical protein